MTIKVGGMDVSGLKFGDINPTTIFTVNGSKYAVMMDSDDPEIGRLDECIAYYATDDEYIADIIHGIL